MAQDMEIIPMASTSKDTRQNNADDFVRSVHNIYTLFQNGGDFNILLSTLKLALLASVQVRYSFES